LEDRERRSTFEPLPTSRFHVSDLKLNLGCGSRLVPGYVNVDKFGEPDLRFDLETFPWPWPDGSVSEVLLTHVLEHLGRDVDTYLRIMRELYRVCRGGAEVRIAVPHFRHDFFWDDPTHVRAITPAGLAMFSKRVNREWQAAGASNTPLALYLDVDFELVSTSLKPGAAWFERHPGTAVDLNLLLRESAIYNNLIEQYDFVLRVIK
jgi:hypothetical protein